MSARRTLPLCLAIGALLSGIAAGPLHAAEATQSAATRANALAAYRAAGPFDHPVKAQLRCWYRESFDPSDPRTNWVEATDFTLEGDWRSVNSVYLGNMFFVLSEPIELEAACRGTLLGKGKGALLHMSAASNSFGYDYEIWYDGDIAARRGKPVERVVAFGDSLSDTGNIYTESRQRFPIRTTWMQGRFSNGPVWTEYLANRLHVPLNTWATGGAQTNDAYGLINGMKTQVDSFVRYSRMGRSPYDVSRTLFTIWIGGNDFVSGGREPAVVLTDLEAALNTLVDRGARKIIVFGLPDLSLAPTFHPLPNVADAGRTDAAKVRSRVEAFNKALPRLLLRVSGGTAAEIQLVDIDLKFDALLANPNAFGFTEVRTSCLDITSRLPTVYATDAPRRPECDPNRYAFWDLMHPTTATHALIADWVLAATPPEWGLRQ